MIDTAFEAEQALAQPSLSWRVEKYVDEFEAVWRRSPQDEPDLGPRIGRLQQLKNGRHLKGFLRTIEPLNQRRDGLLIDKIEQEKIFAAVGSLLSKGVGMEAGRLNLLMSPEFKKSTTEFVHTARRFDDSLSPADLFQACRNVWIMNGLQLLLGITISFTPAIFAYSMLYPYTDNYLDDVTIPRAEKNLFSRRFADRLRGLPLSPLNSHEKSIFALVEMIEGQYSRARFPEVFDSLVAIHTAQTNSLALFQKNDRVQRNGDILRISLEKGGASVLADGYLVAGHLTKTQERFLFGYGAYLQFLDDLQDVREDAACGQLTVYSDFAQHKILDGIANKTFAFGDRVLSMYQKGASDSSNAYVDIIHSCVRLMLIEAVCFSRESFSISFVKTMQRYSPFRFNLLHKLKKRHAPYYMAMFGKTA